MAKKILYIGIIFHILFILIASSESSSPLAHAIGEIAKLFIFVFLLGSVLAFFWSKFKYHHITRYRAKFKDNFTGALVIACLSYIALSLNSYLSFIDDLKKKYATIQTIERGNVMPIPGSQKESGPFGIKMGKSITQYHRKKERSPAKVACLSVGNKKIDFYSTYKITPPLPYKARFSDYYALTSNSEQLIFSIIACKAYESDPNNPEQSCQKGLEAISLDLKIKYNIDNQRLIKTGFINLKDKLIEASCIEHSDLKGKSYLALKYTHLQSFIAAQNQSHEKRIKQAKESSL